MNATRFIAVESRENCNLFFQGETLSVSGLEVRIELFTTIIQNIELYFYLTPEEAKKFYSWNVYPNIKISEDMVEIRLRLLGSESLCKRLNELYLLYSDLNISPSYLLLSGINDAEEFLFRNLEDYNLYYTILKRPYPLEILSSNNWKWDWYMPNIRELYSNDF